MHGCNCLSTRMRNVALVGKYRLSYTAAHPARYPMATLHLHLRCSVSSHLTLPSSFALPLADRFNT
eukprot:357066-Chlamydomonas_euryale.AAC.9